MDGPAPKSVKKDDGPKADQKGSKVTVTDQQKKPAAAAEEVAAAAPAKKAKVGDVKEKKEDPRSKNKYDAKKIAHEEPFNGISHAGITIGHQDTQTTNPAKKHAYAPTSIFPTSHDPTGFAQAAPAKDEGPKADQEGSK